MDTEAQLKCLIQKGRQRRMNFGATPPSIDRQNTLPYHNVSAWLLFCVSCSNYDAYEFMLWAFTESNTVIKTTSL